MSSLADRLRGVIKDVRGADLVRSAPPSPTGFAAQDGRDAAEILGGEWRECRGQRYLVVDRKYAPGHRHGRVAVADTLPPEDGAWPRLSLLAGSACRGRMLFLDVETTGLAGGAGTYAFLIGCGWFDGATFRTRQFFLSNFAAERDLLDALAEVADACGTVVTYNGKTFDLPLIETRFVLHRLETPFAGVPHVDMLHPARRLWRHDAEDGGTRLSVLEESLCGHAREGDVPGFEIPSRYFHFVRSGDARGLHPVLEHNRLDLLSLALLTARASQLLEEGPHAARTAREALGMGRLYERAAMTEEARAAYVRSAEMTDDVITRAEALRGFAVLSRRERRYDDAAAAWRRILDLRRCPAHFVREAAEALAVHHEHRLRDPRSARTFALHSMAAGQSRTRMEALQHRLARLDRKLGAAPAAAALF